MGSGMKGIIQSKWIWFTKYLLCLFRRRRRYHDTVTRTWPQSQEQGLSPTSHTYWYGTLDNQVTKLLSTRRNCLRVSEKVTICTGRRSTSLGVLSISDIVSPSLSLDFVWWVMAVGEKDLHSKAQLLPMLAVGYRAGLSVLWATVNQSINQSNHINIY